jgi:hypothetical protein
MQANIIACPSANVKCGWVQGLGVGGLGKKKREGEREKGN